MKIRPATLSDLSTIQACAAAAYARYVPRIGQKPAPMTADYAQAIKDGKVSVAVVGDRIAGFIELYSKEEYLILETIGLFPEYQRRGIGRALLEFGEEAARKEGLNEIRLYTNEKMSENLSLYRYFGYIETGRKAEDGFNRVFFKKNLE